MMSNKQKFLLLFAVGFLLGAILCTVITMILASHYANGGEIAFCVPSFVKQVGNASLALVIQAVVSGIYGGLVIGATVAYDVEKWSVLKSTAVHCVITLVLYYTTGFLLHWFAITDIVEILIMLGVFVVVYTSIWLINYIRYKSDIKKFNEELQKLKDKDK